MKKEHTERTYKCEHEAMGVFDCSCHHQTEKEKYIPGDLSQVNKEVIFTEEHPSWEKEFDRKTNLDNYQGEFKRLQEDSLFSDDKHQESDFELSGSKIKSFINETLAQERERTLAEVREKIDKSKIEWANDNHEVNKALSDLSSKIKEID